MLAINHATPVSRPHRWSAGSARVWPNGSKLISGGSLGGSPVDRAIATGTCLGGARALLPNALKAGHFPAESPPILSASPPGPTGPQAWCLEDTGALIIAASRRPQIGGRSSPRWSRSLSGTPRPGPGVPPWSTSGLARWRCWMGLFRIRLRPGLWRRRCGDFDFSFGPFLTDVSARCDLTRAVCCALLSALRLLVYVIQML